MASDCCCYSLEYLRTVSMIVNDNAINHSSPNMRLPVTSTNVYLLDNKIPTLRPYSCLKRIKKRSSHLKNDNIDHHQYHRRCHQKHHQQSISHNTHHDVSPQMPKRKSSQENLMEFEFTNSNTPNTNNNMMMLLTV